MEDIVRFSRIPEDTPGMVYPLVSLINYYGMTGFGDIIMLSNVP